MSGETLLAIFISVVILGIAVYVIYVMWKGYNLNHVVPDMGWKVELDLESFKPKPKPRPRRRRTATKPRHRRKVRTRSR